MLSCLSRKSGLIGLYPSRTTGWQLLKLSTLDESFSCSFPRQKVLKLRRKGHWFRQHSQLHFLYKLFRGLVGQAVRKCAEEVIGRVICTYDNFAHCQGLCCCCADNITSAWVDENFVPATIAYTSLETLKNPHEDLFSHSTDMVLDFNHSNRIVANPTFLYTALEFTCHSRDATSHWSTANGYGLQSFMRLVLDPKSISEIHLRYALSPVIVFWECTSNSLKKFICYRQCQFTALLVQLNTTTRSFHQKNLGRLWKEKLYPWSELSAWSLP
jgi:hypothetical protein